ncbi:hypothetical protein L228DRAFT_206565 [Xylona heveae TC161]|uniref:Nuclear pore complex protein n=1 Tax=Xylona heveae (strain CBS 132557 / TC161) TaxID=1328760 RepID=A0A165JJP8_XYLHT|nr:hypothetical protein L228DRAFT_206565 [Xylona heveae TC161]KZF26323.1 hypothetical protein L228DRAFT_206565 [Xylona heveae TC161]
MDTRSLLADGQYEDALHPLRAAAERVGREVEKFAENLDRLNPLNQRDASSTYHSVIGLVKSYQDISLDAVERLRKRYDKDLKARLTERMSRRAQAVCFDEKNAQSQSLSANDSRVSYANGDTTTSTVLEDLENWQMEADTWILFGLLLEFQYPPPNYGKVKGDMLSALANITQYSSEHVIWEKFLIDDDMARERHLILKWLESTADTSEGDVDILVQQLENKTNAGKSLCSQGWMHTKAAIKHEKRLRSWPQAVDPMSPGISTSHRSSDTSDGLVTQLDPDAATRQGLALETQDYFSEKAVWMVCWEMLRRGKSWETIREWCQDNLEGWRAIILRGTRPSDEHLISKLVDPVDEKSPDAFLGSFSRKNRSGVLWRRVCYASAKAGGMNKYERAVFGTLGGDIDSVEPVCQNWDDHLFVHYNSLLLTQFDDYLRQNFPRRAPQTLTQKFASLDSVQLHGEAKSVGQRLMSRLKVHPTTREEARQPMKMIQSALIAKSFGDFVYQQGLALSIFANERTKSKIIPPLPGEVLDGTLESYIRPQDYNSLRVIAHMLLIYIDLGFEIGEGRRRVAIENVLVAYIDFLRLAGKWTMIPLYASKLSADRRHLVLGRLLIDVTDNAERSQQMRLMKGLGIDVVAVLNMQFKMVMSDCKSREKDGFKMAPFELLENRQSSAVSGRALRDSFMGDDISDDDEILIRSFEWYLFLDGYWVETFLAGSSLYKRFLRLGHLAAAVDLANRAPFPAISLTKTRAILGKSIDLSKAKEAQGVDDSSGPAEEALHSEPLAGSHSKNAPKLRERVHRQLLLRQSKTFRELESVVAALVAMQNWTFTKKSIKIESYDPENLKENPKKRLRDSLDSVISSVEALLRGWLLDPFNEISSLQEIRNIYLPEIILAYISVLTEAGSYMRHNILLHCMSLSTLIAAENSDLMECFTAAGRVSELVEAFALSSKAILHANEHGTRSNAKSTLGDGETMDIWQVKL